MEAIMNLVFTFINQLLTIVSEFILGLFGSPAQPITATGEVNAFLSFFKNLVGLIPVLLIAYLIFKLITSGMQVLTKLVGVLLLIALAYLLLQGFVDIDGLVNAGFTWN